MPDRYHEEPLRTRLGAHPLPQHWPPPPSVTDAVTAEPSDAPLVAAMAAGDHDAASRLYDRHASLVYAVALRVTGERSDAEDVVVESFAQAWTQAARYDAGRASVASWLANIARSRALDLVRARGRRERRVVADSVVVDGAPVASGDDDAHARLESAERDARVAGALAALPEAQRAAIELAFYEGLSHAEIATRIATPLGTVKTRIRSGMRTLRALLAPTDAGARA